MTTRLVVAGASGFLGNRLVSAATDRGFQVTRLVRRTPTKADEYQWDPDHGQLDPAILQGAAAVVNLGGVGVGDKRWNDDYRNLIRSSRVRPTALIAERVADVGVPVLLNASAVGYYGPRGAEPIDETASSGNTFLASVCRDWERATEAANTEKTRVVCLRTGLPLGTDGGLLPKLITVTKLFLGGRLGNGRQYFPWIAASDWTSAVLHLLTHEVSGPVNITAPEPVTNAEFTKQLGQALGRPTPWYVPGFALKAVLGGFADEVITGQRAIPAALEHSGFEFSYPTLAQALRGEIS